MQPPGHDEELRFLSPWTLLLPVDGRPVVAVTGRGGKTALLHRLHRHYRGEGLSVLWTQTTDHPAPEGVDAASVDAPPEELKARFLRRASLFVAARPDAKGAWGGLAPASVERLRDLLEPDVVLVEVAPSSLAAPGSSEGKAADGSSRWPRPLHLVLLVAGLQEVGRRRPGAGAERVLPGDDPVPRVQSRDLLEDLLGEKGLLPMTPPGVPVLPFLAGLGSYRDMDGMFEIVARLWEHERVQVVLLGELVGPPRIDQAETALAAGLPGGAPHLAGERVYALYPARLDEDD